MHRLSLERSMTLKGFYNPTSKYGSASAFSPNFSTSTQERLSAIATLIHCAQVTIPMHLKGRQIVGTK